MYDNEYEGTYENDDVNQLIGRYKEMLSSNSAYFFDQGALEQIIEYYEERDDMVPMAKAVDLGLEQYPFSAYFLVKKAELLFDGKESEEALEYLEKAEVYDSSDLNIYLLKSDIHVWQSKHELAITALASALEICEPEDVADIYLEIADVYEDWEKYPEVFEALTQALELQPNNEEALNRIWFCTEITENYEESLELHKNLIDREPYAYLAWFNLGHAYAGLKLYEKAIEAFEFAIAINDKYDYAYRDCGDLHFKLANYKEALENYHEAARLYKPTKELLLKIGNSYFELSDIKKARHFFRKSTTIDPYYSEALYKLGLCYIKEQRYGYALTSLEKAVKYDRTNVTYALSLANAFWQLGEEADAVKVVNECLEQDFAEKSSWIKCIQLLSDIGVIRPALEAVNQAIEKFDKNADLVFIKSALMYQAGNRSQSILNLELGLSIDFLSYPIMYNFAPSMESDPRICGIIEQHRN